jgi:orotate phosphoribosyltransferase
MAVAALRKAGADVLGMVAIFTYGFDAAEENFKNADCKLITITNYEQLLEVAVPEGYITSAQLGLLKEWRENPSGWMQQQ